jgi:hypothetical protein
VHKRGQIYFLAGTRTDQQVPVRKKDPALFMRHGK